MNNDVPLTEEEQHVSVIADSVSGHALHEFLTVKGLDNLKCELCGCGDWMLSTGGGHMADTIAQTIVALDPEGALITVKRPFVFIFCPDCGNTKQMFADLVKARLSPDQPENKALLDAIKQSLKDVKGTGA